jgi:hypothetical protein
MNQVAIQDLHENILGNTKARLKVQLSSPNVQYIEDSHSYDLQSFIGEVGGTLGLTLGLSFLSFISLLHYLVDKIIPA